MRRKINGEAYLIIKKNYTLIIRNSNSDSKVTLLIGLTTISLNKLSFFLIKTGKTGSRSGTKCHFIKAITASKNWLNRSIRKNLLLAKTAFQVIIYKPCRLHVSIADSRAKELKSSFLHILAHRIRLRSRYRNFF